jgi:hypothetical protein
MRKALQRPLPMMRFVMRGVEKEDRAVAYLVAVIPSRDTPSRDYLRTLTETTPRTHGGKPRI